MRLWECEGSGRRNAFWTVRHRGRSAVQVSEKLGYESSAGSRVNVSYPAPYSKCAFDLEGAKCSEGLADGWHLERPGPSSAPLKCNPSLVTANWRMSDQTPRCWANDCTPMEGVFMKNGVNVRAEDATEMVEGVSVASEKTEDKMVIVDVTLSTTVTMPVWAKFRVQVPRSDAANHDVLREACEEQEQEQDAFGYDEPQAGEWQYEYELQDLAIDVLDSEVVSVEEDEDEDEDEE